ncbi:MAG: peptidoglycan DD-metalloendopeptidase family protein [Muribaculaceae bacterium]|nr:peptidoglycan DD-metalloendopeptidase family protein [Muribaculaceae bacterium]
MYYYIKDYQGNVRQVTDADGRVEQDNHYYPYGMLMGESSDIIATARGYYEHSFNPYLYGAKEYLTTGGANLLDFTARTYDPSTLLFQTQDPKAEISQSNNTYLYCGGDPINYIDPDGQREWPVDNPSPIGIVRHKNNYGAPRDGGRRKHQGVDINIGSGNQDKGAPVYATHDGVIIRQVSVEDGNAGGIRITIKSHDGTIKTSYMHLEQIAKGLKVYQHVTEGQQIGNIGDTGQNKERTWDAHLHYEVSVNGNNINPANGAGLIDPQKILDNMEFRFTLDNVTIIGQRTSDNQFVPTQNTINVETLEIIQIEL